MRRLKHRLFHGWAAMALLTLVLGATFTSAGAADSRAGLVVAYGDGRISYVVVSFAGEAIRGVDLLDRSGLAITELSFGSLGVAVCAVDETGCNISECRKRLCQGPQRDDPYWQYFQGAADGTWQVAPLGISGDTIADGSVRAFIWSASTPEFPAPSIDDVAAKAGPANAEGVALARYQADGSLTGDRASDSGWDMPYAAVGVVLLAAVVAGGVYVRQAGGRRS